jgi:hypothetical protein
MFLDTFFLSFFPVEMLEVSKMIASGWFSHFSYNLKHGIEAE